MARRWNLAEEKLFRAQLTQLYKRNNLPIREIAKKLGLAPQTVFQRLQRLGIKSTPWRKPRFLNRRLDVKIPQRYSADLAEFFGVMLGDGHISPTQVIVTLGSKEWPYVKYLSSLLGKIFGVPPKIFKRKQGYHDLYIGSVILVRWLLVQGLVHHKVKNQVSIPAWLTQSVEYQERFLRGFFDTDGSIYKLKFGHQISFSNRSLPLLTSLHMMLKALGYSPSRVSGFQIYLTKRSDLERFALEIGSKNRQKFLRLKQCVGTQVVNEGRL